MIATSRRQMSSSVYMWASMPRLGGKQGAASVKYEMPKGKPKRIEAFDNLNVKVLRVGLRHSAVITEDGELFTFGNGNWGVLGHGSESFVSFNKPKRVEGLVEAGVKVKDVQLGEYHTMALGEDGSVWTWGYGGKKGYFNWMYTQEVGALGHNSLDPYFNPKRVEALKDKEVTHIAAGNYHCIAITKNHEMYNWGRGLYGVLGNGSNQQSLVPSLNEEFAFKMENDPDVRFKQVHAAAEYSAAVMTDGNVFVWGMNDRGQMGVGSGIGVDLVESESLPKCLDFTQAFGGPDAHTEPVVITEVSCGMNTMLLKDHKNRLFKTGMKLDYTPKQIKWNPELLQDDKIQHIGCGRRHYVVVDSDRNLHCIGGIFSDAKEIGSHDGFKVFDADQLFEGGTVAQLSMSYEVYGVLVNNK